MLRSIPLKVRQVVLSDSDCKNLLLCSLTTECVPEFIPVDALMALPLSGTLGGSDGSFATTGNPANGQSGDPEGTAPNEDTQDEDWNLVYDVMHTSRRGILFQREHMTRIMESIRRVSSCPLRSDSIDIIKSCLEEYVMAPNGSQDDPNQRQGTTTSREDCNVKFIAWLRPKAGGAGGPRPSEGMPDKLMFIVYFVKSFFPPPEWYVKGTQFALLFNARRENPNAKVIQTELISRVRRAKDITGAFEIMLVRDEGENYLIPECSRSNYLLITESGKILCSREGDILIGITLLAVKCGAERVGLGAIEHCSLTLEDVCSCHSLLMLGTSPGVLPVRELILYYDAESEVNFRSAASFLKINVETMKNYRVISFDPPKAVLDFVVKSDVIDRLMSAYEEQKFM